ncbi:MAG: hypothetical protein ACOCV1_00125 [Bacillota bacterium]
MKRTIFSPLNALTTIKAWIVGIVTGLIVLIPSMATRWLYGVKQMYGLSVFFGLITLLIFIWTWGYLANKFWRWR